MTKFKVIIEEHVPEYGARTVLELKVKAADKYWAEQYAKAICIYTANNTTVSYKVTKL